MKAESQACCACLTVICKTTPGEQPGTVRDRWVCKWSDEHEFVRKGRMDYEIEQRDAEIARLRARLALLERVQEAAWATREAEIAIQKHGPEPRYQRELRVARANLFHALAAAREEDKTDEQG